MKLYLEAEQFISSNPKQGSLQTRIFSASKNGAIKSSPKHIYALVYSTLRYKAFILELIKKSGVLKVEKKNAKLTESLCILLIHDLLFTKNGRIQSGKHPLKEAILRHKARLQAELVKLKMKHKVKDLEDLIEDDDTPVRWFRANTIKATRSQVLSELKHLEQVFSIDQIKPGTIYHDEYIPNLFGVSPKDKITSSQTYLGGRIIIQDRASCFPAHILNPGKGDKVIDSCAAPGNKTTHLASYVENIPNSVFAFEKDPRRAQILKTMCNKAGASKCINVQIGDFTRTNPEDFPEVTGFVVDPSCSGSGIFGRAHEEENSKEDNYDEQRLQKLSGFQFTIVKHAMSFPAVKKVVYSTCSIHAQENERVVVDLLNDPKVKERGWRVCSRSNVIPTWPRRGFAEEFTSFPNGPELAEGCIRSLPKVDGGIGFFAVAFERDVDDQDIPKVAEVPEIKKQPKQQIKKRQPKERIVAKQEESVGDEEWSGFD